MSANLLITNESYTFGDLDAYGRRLHVNTALNVIINSFASYIVLKHSNKAMGKYKYYIFLTIISAAFMDFHGAFIYGAYPTFPIPGFCGAGVATRSMNYFWGEVVHALFLHLTISFCGNSLLISFFYRYRVMTGDIKIFHSFYGILTFAAFVLFYPIIPMILFVAIQSSHEEILEYIKERAPNMYEIYRDGPCHSFKMEKCIIYLIVLILHICGIWMFGYVIASKTIKLISANRQSLSGATYRLYRQFLFTLGIQAIVPLFFIFLPLIVVITVIMSKSEHAKIVSENAFQVLFFHSAVNGLSILLSLKTYRKAVKSILLKPFWFYKPNLVVKHKIQNIMVTRSIKKINDKCDD